MKYTVHQAKTNLSRLLEEAAAGREVIIARGDEPVAQLVPVGKARRKRQPGSLVGQITPPLTPFTRHMAHPTGSQT